MLHIVEWLAQSQIFLGTLCFALVFVPIIGIWAVHKYQWQHWEPFTKKHK